MFYSELFIFVAEPVVGCFPLPRPSGSFLHFCHFCHFYPVCCFCFPTPSLPGWINNPNLSADCRKDKCEKIESERQRGTTYTNTHITYLPRRACGNGVSGKVLRVAFPATAPVRHPSSLRARGLFTQSRTRRYRHTLICTQGQGSLDVMCEKGAIKKGVITILWENIKRDNPL